MLFAGMHCCAVAGLEDRVEKESKHGSREGVEPELELVAQALEEHMEGS